MNYTYARDRYVHDKATRIKMLEDIQPSDKIRFYVTKPEGRGGPIYVELRPPGVYLRGSRPPVNGSTLNDPVGRTGRELRARRHRLNPGRRSVLENRMARHG